MDDPNKVEREEEKRSTGKEVLKAKGQALGPLTRKILKRSEREANSPY
ncbi:MAG: hypothetical protein HXS52_03995 [Theionarchaea archaeon]|nr:hypothetical protein [Theionarchaea archaeon]MBU7037068.1 hypothetical protein [Theionarchaea archaeon]